MESDGASALREAGGGFVGLHRFEVSAVSDSHKTTGHQRRDTIRPDDGPARVSSRRGERDRRQAQEYCVRGTGRLRNSDDERGADGNRENEMQECVSRGGRGTELESQWKNYRFRSR